MSVDAGVSGGAGKVLVLPVGDVLVSPLVTELLGQPEIYHVHQVTLEQRILFQIGLNIFIIFIFIS